MSLTVQQFINKWNNQYVQWRECVALFWQFNEDVMTSENYAAVGAINLYTSNSWSTYTKTTAPAVYGDWTIWSGTYGAYPNGGYGHVAMFISDNGNGTGKFFSQNPNPAQIINLSYSGIVGHLRPKFQDIGYAGDDITPLLESNQRLVGNANVNQRAKADTTSDVVRIVKANTVETFTGYVRGESVSSNNIWYKDNQGYCWSGGFVDKSTKGLKDETPITLKANQRWVGDANVNQRAEANDASKVVRLIKANTIETFTGYVKGESIAGNDIWFKDAAGYAWSGGFTDKSTKGLKDETPIELKANQRWVVDANVNQRSEPNSTSKVIRLIQANTIETFTGFVHGEDVAGNDVWFKDAKGYAWSGGFVDSSTKGLKDETPKPAPTPEIPETPPNDLKPNERMVGGTNLNQRVQPTTESVVLRVIPANTLEVFTGYVHGQSIENNDIWFKDNQGFAWSGGFIDKSTNGLIDQTDSLDDLPPLDAPYEFTPDFDFVEYIPAHTTNMQHGHFPKEPTHVVLHQFNSKHLRPSIEGVISHFKAIRPGGESSAHFVVSRDRIIQMVSLNDRAYHAGTIGNNYIGIEIDPQEDAETIASVKKLLEAIKDKLGYLPIYIEHQNVEGNVTSCGIDIHLENYTLDSDSKPDPAPKPEPIPVPEPETPPEKTNEEIVANLEEIIAILKKRLK